MKPSKFAIGVRVVKDCADIVSAKFKSSMEKEILHHMNNHSWAQLT